MNAASQQLYAVLLALQGDTLLLPNLAVAEVVSPEGLRPLPGAPPWFAGLLPWHGRELPIARFELFNAGAAEPPNRRTRIALINPLGSRLSTGGYGIVTEGYPHLVTLNRSALRPAERRPQDSELILARVRVASQEAWIPDLERIEGQLAEVLAAMPA